MQKVLEYSGLLNILYIENETPIRDKDYKTLVPFFKDVIVSPDLDEYIKHHQILDEYPDIVMIDVHSNWESCLSMIGQIREIHPNQMIVIISDEYKKGYLAKLMRLRICYCLDKPIEFEDLYDIAFEASKEIYNSRLVEANTNMLHQRVSELDNTIQTIEYSRETKDQFFANVSHEIRTPINAVIGLSHILLDTDIDAKYLDYVSKIETSGNLILNIVNDILDFSKIEAGKLSVENIDFNINTVLDNVSTMVDFKAYEKRIELIFDIDESVPAIMKGDPLRLSQILINLMTNAVKFTHEGEVILKAKLLPFEEGKQLIEFCISDTGIGIKPENITNLFQTFTQADSTTSRNFGGTGLGLTISKQLVELMGGDISVTSQFGKGSQFTFTVETTMVDIDVNSYSLPSQKLKNKKVLIVDKSIQTKKALERMLHYFGYITLEASSVNDLMAHIKEHDFDILFIDYKLAMECKVKITKEECRAKIVLMHHTIEVSDEKTFNKIDVDAHLIKPFNHQIIFGTILKIFGEERVSDISTDTFVSKKNLKSIGGSHILMAEDNQINQSVVIALLEDTGINMTIAENGQELLDKIDTIDPVDLILMDLEMPVLDGYETTKLLREESKYDDIPIIALSGNTTAKDKEDVRKIGMHDHLGKPMDVNAFYGFLLKYIKPKVDFSHRLDDATEEFPALIGVGQYQEAMKLSILLQKEADARDDTKVKKSLVSISNNLEKHEKVFLILIKNYEKAFNIFLSSADKFLSADDISDKEFKEIDKIVNIVDGIENTDKDEELYRIGLGLFCDKFRDSVEVLIRRVQNLKFEEATQLSYQIKREARDIGASALSQSLEPIVAIEQTQRSQLDNEIISFTKIVKENEHKA